MALPAPRADRTAVVTGASSGIGAEIARELARRGHGVTLVARRAAEMEELAEELRGTTSLRCEVLPADLTDRAERAALVERVADLGLDVDIVVNNAGMSTVGPVSAADPGREMQMVELDVVAVVDLCTRWLPGMVQRRSGAVLNVASTAAFQPLPGQAGYGASKAFVLSYTRAIRGELRGTGVTATALCPGPVHTGFGEAAGFDLEDAEASLPAFMWEPVEAVALCGVDAMADGRDVAIPGAANRVSAVVSGLVPKRLLVPLLAKQHPGLKD